MFGDALWIGLAIAAPVGPIGVLVIQRTLRHGRTLGLATGLGAALAAALTMVAGVLAGSALWWLLLSTAVGALRRRFDERAQRRVNRLSALGLAGFALWQWGGLLQGVQAAAPA